MLLLGVAAVGGVPACVAVAPGEGPGTGSVRGAPARADPGPRITQPPAHAVLEATGPSRRPVPGPVPPPSDPPRRPAAAPVPARPAPSAAPAPSVPRVPAVLPGLPALPPLPEPGAGPCALGERYGDWAPDSAQSRLCDRVYGR